MAEPGGDSMSFELSKIFWGLAKPSTLLLLAIALGALLLWLRWSRGRRIGRWLLTLAAAWFLLISLFPLERLWLQTLETRFPRPALPARVDGIVVLGGALSYVAFEGGETPQINESGGDRLAAFVALARRYPAARLVFAGGSGSVRKPEVREADDAADILAALGLERDRIILERESRNTWENAVFARELAAPLPGETWVVITSAFHMPRAIGCFRAAGWGEVLAYPVDYLTSDRDWLGFDVDPLYSLGALDIAAKEWIGLLAYWLMDRTPALFPAP